MQVIGYFNFIDDVEFYYSDNFINFYKKEDESLVLEHEMEEYAIWLNSPWSYENEKYIIKYNCKDGTIPENSDDMIWKCSYIVHGYDGVVACVIGYGNSEALALLDCKKRFTLLQERYNPENISY